MPSDAERRIEIRQEVAALIDDAVAVGIAQQCDEIVSSRRSPPPPCRHPMMKPRMISLGRLKRLAGRRFRLHHQHVAVGQRVDRPRICQISGIGGDDEAFGHGRRLALLPADNFRHLEIRQQALRGRRQDWIGADLLGNIEIIFTAGGQEQCGAERR